MRDAAQAHADQWLADILAGRADKTWTPNLFASAALVEYLGTVAGLPVTVSENLPNDVLLLKCSDSERRAPDRRGIPDDGERARLTVLRD